MFVQQGLGWSPVLTRTASGSIAYLALVAVRHHAAVDAFIRCAFGNQRLWEREDGQAHGIRFKLWNFDSFRRSPGLLGEGGGG